MTAMTDGKKKKQPRKLSLIIVLVSLCVVIIALVVGIIALVNNANRTNEKNSALAEFEEKWEEGSEDLNDRLMSANIEAQTLASQEPIDVTKINELYDAVFTQAFLRDRKDYMLPIIKAENDLLLAHGLKQEALQVLRSINYEILAEPDQYRVYAMIIELAGELGDTEMVTQYQDLQKGVEEAYLENQQFTEEYLKSVQQQQERNN